MFDKKKLQAKLQSKMKEALQSNPAAAEQMKRMEGIKDQLEGLANDPEKLDQMMKGPEVKRPDLAAVKFRDQRPRPVWMSLLDMLKFEPNGHYAFKQVHFAYLPTHDVNGNEIGWQKSSNPEADEDRLHVEIYKDGALIADHWMRANEESRMTHIALVDSRSPLTTNIELLNHKSRLDEGDYEFVFKIHDEEFYRIAASVVRVLNSDRYAELPYILRLNGAHDKYMGVTFTERQTAPLTQKSPGDELKIMLFHRNPLVQFDTSEQRLFGHLYFEGERIAYTDVQLGAGHSWTFKSGDFTRWRRSADPREAGRVFDDGVMTREDMKDGRYMIVLFSTELSDEKSLHYKRLEGAAKIEYSFEWQSGRFVLPDHMDDQTSQGSNIIEGLGDTLWLEAENGPHPWLFDSEGNQRPGTGQGASWIDPDARDDDPWPLNYSTADDPIRASINEKLDAITKGEVSFEDSGLPEPDWDSNGGEGYSYKTAVETAIHHYQRVQKQKSREADQRDYEAQRAKEAEETATEVAKAQSEAQDYAAQAAEEARKAQEEAQRMIEEMQKKHGL